MMIVTTMVDGNHSIRSAHSASNYSNSESNKKNNNRIVPITPQMVKPRLENHELFSPLSDDGDGGGDSDEDDLFADSATTTSELFGQCSKFAPTKSMISSSKVAKTSGMPQQHLAAFEGSVLVEEDDDDSDVHESVEIGNSREDIRDVVHSDDLEEVDYGDDHDDDEDESVPRYPANAVNNPQFGASLSDFGFDDNVMANYQAMESGRAKAKRTPAFGIVDTRRSFHSTDASATHTLQPVAAVPIPFKSKRGKKPAKEFVRRSASSSQDSMDSAGLPLAPMLDLETLEQQKQDAIDEEDYLRAAQIKKQIESLQNSPELAKIEQLESLKKLAVRQEDYVKAAELKAQIEELKGRRRSNRQHHVRSSLNAALDTTATAAPEADNDDKNRHQSSKRQQQSLDSFFGQQSEDEEILEELEQEEGVDYIEDDPAPARGPKGDTFLQSLHSRSVSQHSRVDNFGFVMEDLDDIVPNLVPEDVHESASGEFPLQEEKSSNPDWYANIVSSVKKSNKVVVDSPAASQRRSRRTTRTGGGGGGRSASRSRSRSRTRREKLRRSCKAKAETVEQVASSGGEDRRVSKSRRDGRRTVAPVSPRETGESSGHGRRRSRSRSRRERPKASTSLAITSKANPSPRHDQQPGIPDLDGTSPGRKSSIVSSSGKASSPFALQNRKVPAPQNESPDGIRKRGSSSRKLLMENQASLAKKDSSLQDAIHVRSPPPSDGGGSHHKRGAASFRRTPPPPAPFDSSPAANSIKSFASEGCHLNSSKSNALSRRLHRQSSMDDHLGDDNHPSSNTNSRSKHSRRCGASARTQSMMDNSLFAVESTASSSNTKNNIYNHNSEASPGKNPRPSFRRGDSGIHSSVSTPSTSSRGGGRRLPLLESPTGVDGMPLESPEAAPTASGFPILASSDSAKIPSKYLKEIQTTLARLERLKERSSRRQALAVSGSSPTNS